MIEEEEKASNQIHFIVNEINSISTESAIQQIGTQIKSQFNLTIHEIVGSNNSQNNSSTTNLKRTTYISNDNIHQTISSSTQISDQQTKSIHKSVNQK